MEPNLNKIAQELYGKIQTRFPSIKIGDENAQVLSKEADIPNARFFEFEYEENGEPLGTIAISLDADKGLVVQVSGDLTKDNDNVSHHKAYKFIRSFGQFANRRFLNFDIQNIGKSNLDKRDYQFQAKRKEFPMMENKLFGTTKVSYQDLGEARLIIKHNQHINTELPAGRTMHIESIYIQNLDGERFKYPFKHLNGARALAEHVKHGGNPYDAIGKHIIGLSEELGHLRKFKGFVGRNPLIAETMENVTNKVIERIEEIKKEILHLQRPTYYESFVESFEEKNEQIIPEDVVNDLVDRLTIRTFNEELKSVFPYIFNLLDESDIPVCELSAEDLLDEEQPSADICPKTGKSPCKCDDLTNEQFDPEFEFEYFMDSIINEAKNELFSPLAGAQNQAIEELNKLLALDLSNGTNVALSLKGIIDDPKFIEKIEVLNSDPEIRSQIKNYILDKDPQLMNRIEMPQTGEPIGGNNVDMPPQAAEVPAEPMQEPVQEPTQAAEVPPAGTPQPPVAESNSVNFSAKHGLMNSNIKRKKKKLRSAIKHAKEAGAKLDTRFKFNGREMSIREAIIECDLSFQECGFENEGGMQEMLEFISGFYNREEKNFPLGGQRIKIKIKKDFEDGRYPNATPKDLIKILKFIDIKDPSDQNTPSDFSPLTHVDPREQHVDEITNELNSVQFYEDMDSIIKLAGIKK